MSSTALLSGPADNTRPVVAFDLEGTVTAGSAWRGMSEYLIANGREREAKRYVVRNLPGYYLRRLSGRGLHEFKTRWIHGLFRMFEGYSEDEFREMTDWAVKNELWPQRREVVVSEMEQHQQEGRRVLVVTGLFEPYVASVLSRLPGVEGIGTPIVFEDGKVTGELGTPFNVGERKAEKLRPFMQEGKIYSAYGDTEPDQYMLGISQQPVAVYPDKALRKLAKAGGWRILDTA